MPNLADSFHATQFVQMLETCEHPVAYRWLTDWEIKFVESMREGWDSREMAADLGAPQWNPSVGQWNTFKEIAGKMTI